MIRFMIVMVEAEKKIETNIKPWADSRNVKVAIGYGIVFGLGILVGFWLTKGAILL